MVSPWIRPRFAWHCTHSRRCKPIISEMKNRLLKPYGHYLLPVMVMTLALLCPRVHAQPLAVLEQEYFVRQNADQPLVIRITPFEGAFTAHISDKEGRMIHEASLQGNRNFPVFIFIDAHEKSRQLDIRIKAPWRTRATQFDLEYNRLDVRDDLSTRLSLAYQSLSLGQALLTSRTAANWSVRVNLLLQAARAFGGLGMEEMRLWSQLSAAYLAHHELADTAMAQDLVSEVIAVSRRSGRARMELASLTLQADILLAQPGEFAAATEALQDVERLAGVLGAVYERAFARFLLGTAMAEQERNEEALVQYESALQIAEQRGASELVTDIRQQMVEMHERLGDLVSKEAALDSVVSELSVSSAQDELVRNLLQQGALYLELSRYPSAIEALRNALTVDAGSLIEAQASIMLGEALYATGRFDDAQTVLEAGLAGTEPGRFRRPNPLLPLEQGLRLLANTLRAQGELKAVRSVRSAQLAYVDKPSQRGLWYFEAVLDSLARGESGAAWRYRSEAMPIWAEARQDGLSALAHLHLCAGAPSGREAECAQGALSQSHARVSEFMSPADQASAGLAWARNLRRLGLEREAGMVLNQTLRLVHFYHTRLRGALGAWYWTKRSELFTQALSGTGSSNAAELFAVLVRIHAIERTAPSPENLDQLRGVLAREGGAHASVLAARNAFEQEQARYTEMGIRQALSGLASDSAVVAMVHDDGLMRAWIARNNGVITKSWPVQERTIQTLEALRGEAFGSRSEARNRAGEALLGPIADALPEKVLWYPMGPLLGLVPGSLSIQGAPESGRWRLDVVPDFPNVGAMGRELAEKVFVAANPVDWSSDYLQAMPLDRETGAVIEHFVGPGLHIVQGSALLEDEFADIRFAEAELIHLSVPARIDLEDEEASYLELSEPGRAQGRARLRPSEIRELQINNAVIVLSQASWRGHPRWDFAARVPLVDDLLDAGGSVVIVPAAPLGAQAAAEFASTVYSQWAEQGLANAVQLAARASPVPLQVYLR